jgi:hypothetical protein
MIKQQKYKQHDGPGNLQKGAQGFVLMVNGTFMVKRSLQSTPIRKSAVMQHGPCRDRRPSNGHGAAASEINQRI